MISEVNLIPSSLFLTIVCLTSGTNSSMMWILTMSSIWSEWYYRSDRMKWLSSSEKLGLRNIRSITELELFPLSRYLVVQGLVGCEEERSKTSAMSKRRSL